MRKYALPGLALAAILWLGAGLGDAVSAVLEPDGYRMEDYRAPVPDQLTGGRRIETPEALGLWTAGQAVFIDVYPKPPTPQLPKGTVFRQPPHVTIKGAIWLPDVGYGVLADDMQAYFEAELQRVTAGDVARQLVFFCQADCWMSWNAARRAISLGYQNVLWYAEGVDGWGFEGLPTVAGQPVPRPGIQE